MKVQSQAFRIQPLSKIDKDKRYSPLEQEEIMQDIIRLRDADGAHKSAQVLHLEEWKRDHFAQTNDMIEDPAEEQLTQEEQQETADLNRQMGSVGIVGGIVAALFGALVIIVQATMWIGR